MPAKDLTCSSHPAWMKKTTARMQHTKKLKASYLGFQMLNAWFTVVSFGILHEEHLQSFRFVMVLTIFMDFSTKGRLK